MRTISSQQACALYYPSYNHCFSSVKLGWAIGLLALGCDNSFSDTFFLHGENENDRNAKYAMLLRGLNGTIC